MGSAGHNTAMVEIIRIRIFGLKLAIHEIISSGTVYTQPEDLVMCWTRITPYQVIVLHLDTSLVWNMEHVDLFDINMTPHEVI